MLRLDTILLAKGELTIRYSLQFALNHFGVAVKVVRSDQEFARINLSKYDIIIVDPWTWAAKGRAQLSSLVI